MKKYLFIFKSEVMSNIQYVMDILTGFIGYFVLIFIFLNLWEYIYSDPNEIINGYTMKQMIWYIVVTEILWSATKAKYFCDKIIEDIKGGSIAYNLTKPYNYISYLVFTHLGKCTVRGFMYIILGLLTGYLFLGTFPNLNILTIILVFITGVLATVITSLIVIFIGLFSLFIEDSSPFFWLYSKFILVIGSLFPIEYFPVKFQGFLKFSPVYVVSYGPARLFTKFNYNEFVQIFGAQIIYIFLAYILCMLIYKRGVKKLNVNGG